MSKICNPVIVCGFHGGGTSFVAKMLRWGGMFMGADAGPMAARKWHEPAGIKQINIALVSKLLGGDIRRGTSTKQHRLYIDHYNMVSSAMRNVELVTGHQLKAALEQYSQGFCFDTLWGWKDPRNSLTLPFWSAVFPTIRILIVEREWREGLKSTTPSGRFFTLSEEWERGLYYNPPFLQEHPDVDCMRVSFDKIIREESEARNMFRWLGLSTEIIQKGYNKFLDTLGLEGGPK